MDTDESTRHCPDCAAETGDGQRPASEFYRSKAPHYAGGYRYGAYCKRHQNARNLATKQAALAGDTPAAETIRRVKRDWAREHPENARKNSASYRDRKKTQPDPTE